MILILGPRDIHTERVADRVLAQGGKVDILNSGDFPGLVTLSGTLDFDEPGSLRLQGHLGAIPLGVIQSVYWYAMSGYAMGRDCGEEEADSGFGSLLRNLDCHWVNPPQAVGLHRYKFHQLKLLKAANIRVPDSLMTNDPEALLAFYEKHQGRVICKPLYQGLLLHRLTKADLAPERIERLRESPLLFQEYIEGTDIRVHVVGEETFASEVVSELFNYKTDFFSRPVEIPDSIRELSIRAARVLGLVLAGIDFRRTETGEYVMFEGNPSPQYLVFEDQCGYPISDALATNLLNCK
jgi:glutathione synthase/RimK-type ligase-like ATP-grasp enzyme